MTERSEISQSSEIKSVIQSDFGNFFNSLDEDFFSPKNPIGNEALREEDANMPFSKRSIRDLSDSLGRSSKEFAWFSERGNMYERKKPYASPEDYLEIRNSEQALRSFMELRLDGKKYNTSFGGMGGEDHETSIANYMHFMYIGSNNEEFRTNVRKVTIELLTDELNQDFNNFDYHEARKRVLNYREFHKDEPGYSQLILIDGSELEDLRENLKFRLEINEKNTKDQALLEKLTKELSQTARPQTEEEFAKDNWIPKKDVQKRFKQAQEQGEINSIVHFDELTEDTKNIINERIIHNSTISFIKHDASSRYQRLTTLLELVTAIGNTSDEFSQLTPILKGSIESKRFEKVPDLHIGAFLINVENHILMALTEIQKGTELRDLWQEKISNDPNKYRTLNSIIGIMNMHDDKEARQDEIPGILSALSKRTPNLEKKGKKMNYETFSWHDGVDLNYYISERLRSFSYNNYPFVLLDKNYKYFDALQNLDINSGKYKFLFDRINKIGKGFGEIVYDAENDKFTGATEFKSTVNSYFDQRGLQVSDKVRMETLIGKKITDSAQTIILEGVDENTIGSYEGIMKLNLSDYAYLFNPITNELKLSKWSIKDLRSKGYTTWENKKPDLTTLTKRVNISKLIDLEELGESIDTESKERFLTKRVTKSIEEPIIKILTGRLTRSGRDLIK